MKNFAYQIEKNEYSEKITVAIYELGGKMIKEYSVQLSGLDLPASGCVVDGLHYPDAKKDFGNWRFSWKYIPATKEIPNGVTLEDGAVMIYGKRTLDKDGPQTIGQIRENRDMPGGNEWNDNTHFLQNGNRHIVPGLLVFPSQFGEEWFVLHGKLWNSKPKGVLVPKWVSGLV